MSYEALAFYTGLFGSLHCVSMCGPLVLALPFSNQPIWISALQRLIYQVGRILMYGLAGLVVGLFGQGFSFLGLQQFLSLTCGFFLLIGGLNHFRKRGNKPGVLTGKMQQKLAYLLGKYLSKPYGSFIAGALNGLLPCGVSYIALAQAIALTDPLQSARSMIFFGLGTVPLLFFTALVPLVFRKFRTPAMLVPVLFMVAGSFLIARGFNVQIPYVSHAVTTDTDAQCD